MNWDQLCRLAPALRQFEADARSIARYERWPWYERWIGGFRDLRSVLSDVAARHHLDSQEARQVALAELKAIYRTARARRRPTS